METNDLLSGSDTVQDVQVKAAQTGEVLTEVTSIAKEEERTGIKQEMPSAEELVTRASTSTIVNTKKLADLIFGKAQGGRDYKISRKGMNRVLLSILSLPTEGIPVNLTTNEEKLAFALGQRLISDRFILMQDHISKELRRQAELKSGQTTAQTEQNQGESNEQQ